MRLNACSTRKNDRSGRVVLAHLALALVCLVGALSASQARTASAALVPYAVGHNYYGQLGVGTTYPKSADFVRVTGLPPIGIVEMEGGLYHNVALLGDGSVWAWGGNSSGQLGNDSTLNSPVAVPVSGLADVVDVSAGWATSVALKRDGTVWAWGSNSAGECGDGTVLTRLTPVQVRDPADQTGFLTGIVAIAGGGSYALALKADGTVRAWGSNNFGGLGDGTTTRRYAPVTVLGLDGVVAIDAGSNHSIAIKDDGTVWTWGWNNEGQLGNANLWVQQRTTAARVVDPTDPSGYLTGITKVAAGERFCLALKADGTLRAWGKNFRGQLGTGDFNRSYVPLQVEYPWDPSGYFQGVVSIATGEDHSLALTSDGSMWAWGHNAAAQLGAGGITAHSVWPLKRNIPDYTYANNGAMIAAGGYHSLFVVEISNQPPVADAGPDQTVAAGSSVVLDGSGSHDPDPGDHIGFSWEFVSIPPGSASFLYNAGAQYPWFVADLSGDYVLRLVVTDIRGVPSEPDEVRVSSLNSPPVAVAGPDRTARRGETVTLNGSASHDPDAGDTLALSWRFVALPAGSAAILADPLSPFPSFVPDLPGDYRLELIAVDSHGTTGAPDEVLVNVQNSTPVADAGPDQAVVLVGSTIVLDGSRSWDGDNDGLAYAWSFLAVPAGSAATLTDPSSPTPSFVADVHGDYVLSLVVSDAWCVSEPDAVTAGFTNLQPVAIAGPNRSVLVGSTVALDGSGSSDANLDPLTYQWTIAERPAASLAAPADPVAVTTSFVADQPGTYALSLVVNDGFVDSYMSSATVTAVTVSDSLIAVLQELIRVINALDDADFKNPNMRHALTSKVNAVITQVTQGSYEGALQKLANDVSSKSDGCAKVFEPDQTDWLVNCAAQGQVQPLVVEAMDLLRMLL